MKSPQPETSSVTQNQLASIFKALGSTTRLSILNFLTSNPNSNCMRIVAAHSHSQSTISKHLSELKSANIVQTSYVDAVLIYEINKDFIVTIQNFLNDINSITTKQTLNSPVVIKSDEKQTKLSSNNYSKLKQYNHIFSKNRRSYK